MTKLILSILLLIFLKLINSNEILNQSSITHLHEINNNDSTLSPLINNSKNYDATIIKTVKKKPYAILEKPSDIDKHRQLTKNIESHSIAFDFNVDNLDDDDIHGNIKKGDLTSEEKKLLRDNDDDDLDIDDRLFKYENVDLSQIVTTKNTSAAENYGIILDNTTNNNNNNNISTLTTTKSSTSIIDKGNFTNFDNRPNIFRVISKSKLKIKGRELFKKEELQKNFGNHFNSVNQLFNEHTTDNHTHHHNNNDENDYTNENLFQIMVNLYDHFYWQPSVIRTSVTPVCGVELIAYLSALNNNYEWAQKAYDTSGHYRGQIMYGNNLWIGQKQFCNEVNRNIGERKHFDFGFFIGKILIKISLPTELTRIIQLGECLPKSCTTKDIQTILELDPHSRMLMSLNSTHQNSEIKVLEVRRVPGSYIIWKDLKFRLFMSFIIIIIIIICYATWFESNLKEKSYSQKLSKLSDNSNNEMKMNPNSNNNNNNDNLNDKAFELYQMNSTVNNNADVEQGVKENLEKSKKKIIQNPEKSDQKRVLGLHEKTLLCFAFPTNAATILSLKRNREDTISCVHGIRVISLLWTVLVHTYLELFVISENRFVRNISERTFIYQMVGNATFSVDSFFFLSGLLVVLIFLKHHKPKDMNIQEFSKKGFLKSAFLIIYRYLRLTPVYLFVIIFNELSILYSVNDSVYTPAVSTEACSNYWWRNILYINNLYPLNDLCMIWSWYLANDMQFYIMAIILLILSTRYLKLSFIITFGFLLTSWGTSGILSIHNNYLHKVSQPFESFDFLYDKPWQRVGTYIIGMMTGYIIYRVKSPPKISKGLNLILWILSLGLLFILIFGVWNGQLSLLPTAFYVSIGHTAWGIGLVWITLSCCWGYSPFINKILSYQGFLPLSRLTYCTYLIHPIIMIIISYLMVGPAQLDHFLIFTIFLGNAVLSFIVAFLISVAFESPVIRLLKIYLKK